MKKRGENVRKYRKRWFILKGNLIYYFKTEQDSTPLGFSPLHFIFYFYPFSFEGDSLIFFPFLGVIPLPTDDDNVAVDNEDEEGLTFMINSSLRTYILRAENITERNSWVAFLQQVCQQKKRG